MTLAEFMDGLTAFQESQFNKLVGKLRSAGIKDPQPTDPDVISFVETLSTFQQSHFYKIAGRLLTS